VLRTLLLLLLIPMTLDAQTAYQRPPKVITDVLESPLPPGVSVSPTKDWLAFTQNARYPGIAEVAEPMLRLAGVRLNPRTNGPARESGLVSLSFLELATRKTVKVKLPEGKVSAPQWSNDGKQYAVTITKSDSILLGVGQVGQDNITVLPGLQLSDVLGKPLDWLDNSHLLLQLVPGTRGVPPAAPVAPAGPIVQESSGRAAPVRTFQDMLTNAHDEALFEFYATSQLAVQEINGTLTKVGAPGLFTSVSTSPSGKYLLVTRLKKPFSYLYPSSAFPKVIEVWDRTGKLIHTVADLPLQDKVPIEGVATGPRGVRWVPTEESTLMWAEALDGGDPKRKVPHRDELMMHKAPFDSTAKAFAKTEYRFGGASFLQAGNLMVSDFDRERKWTRTVVIDPQSSNDKPLVVFDRSINDRYADPGTPLTRLLPNGERVLQVVDGCLLLNGIGATPKGDFPKLTKFNPATKKSDVLFQCKDGLYEQVVSVLDDEGRKLLIRRESPTEPANYFLRDGDKETQLTENKDPFPELRKVKKQLVTTKRKDGVTISFTLYTPAGTKDGEKLPTVFWAYPKEFNDAATAGQVSGSAHRFTTIGGYSHLWFLTQGYAVMDEVSMPIVGPPESANDSFREQLVETAKAAIEKASEVGPVDRRRIGVGGHSYGAFMTANLLAHCDLFRAGIARSGAYNRTLTPFGFQNERRTFWEAPEVYSKMSPFNNAQKVNEPLLMIHGQADSNPGTFPVQSERMYQAVRGNGGTVRLVLLPHEDHGYAAKESIEHVIAEQLNWFDKYVKNAQ
jgi:dipeptidyl aminopeptidase/acylaminoacyl peptidase